MSSGLTGVVEDRRDTRVADLRGLLGDFFDGECTSVRACV
jgi:hypothetical protein